MLSTSQSDTHPTHVRNAEIIRNRRENTCPLRARLSYSFNLLIKAFHKALCQEGTLWGLNQFNSSLAASHTLRHCVEFVSHWGAGRWADFWCDQVALVVAPAAASHPRPVWWGRIAAGWSVGFPRTSTSLSLDLCPGRSPSGTDPMPYHSPTSETIDLKIKTESAQLYLSVLTDSLSHPCSY